MPKKRYESTEERARKVREIVSQNYEEGRQDRCKSWVFRTIIKKQFGISERTFFRYLGIKPKPPDEDERQLKLF